MSCDEIVLEARDWIGTPYRHQASRKGQGTDCLGLLRGVWRARFGNEPEVPPAYTMDWDEVASRDVLLAAAERYLERRTDDRIEPGDVLLFRMRRGAVAKHLGICSTAAPERFIHAYVGHGVVENALSDPWRRKIVGVFRFPERSLNTF